MWTRVLVVGCFTALCVAVARERAGAGIPVCEGVVTANDTVASQDGTAALDTFDWTAQSFVVSSTVSLTKVAIQIANQGVLTDSVTVQIRTGGPAASDPPGSTIVTSASMVDANAALHFASFSFAPGTVLTAGTPYYIVATAAGGPANGYIWGADGSSPTYTLGQAFSSPFGSFMPGDLFSRPDVDMLFQVYGACTPPPTSTPTLTPTNTPPQTPTSTPTGTPTETPTITPTETPTSTPTGTPTETPTSTPTITPTPGSGEGGQGVETCNDGIDNDGDQLADCADSECADAAACIAQVPTMNPTMLAFTVFVVLAIGTFGILGVSRRR